MKKIAGFIINKRIILFIAVLIVAAVCAVLSFSLKTNTDMAKYLPDDSNMKQGLDIIASDFPASDDNASIRVMFDNLTEAQKDEVKSKLEAISNVNSVEYEADSADYNKADHTLFIVNTAYGYDTAEEAAIEKAIDKSFGSYQMRYQNNDVQSTKATPVLLLSALAIALLILVIMSQSWLEPVLFMATIGVAVLINLGTNIIFPYTSDLTSSVAPIIQLALSMDYSIILMNRYRLEKQRHESRLDAIKAALASSFSSIASSSLTTVVGLLALVFLTFKVGPELGIVLAKGVFISMLCVFTVLPALILWCDKGIEKSAKKFPHISMGGFAKFSHKARFVMPVLFAALFAAFYFIHGNTKITFTEGITDPLAKVFPKENTIVMVYENEDENAIDKLISEAGADEHVKSIAGYTNTLGTQLNAAEMAAAISETGSAAGIDESLIRMIYFLKSDGQPPVLTVPQFIAFIQEKVLTNPYLSGAVDQRVAGLSAVLQAANQSGGQSAGGLDSDNPLIGAIASGKAFTSAEMHSLLEGLAPGVSQNEIELIYLYYGGLNSGDPDFKMTIPQLMDYLCSDLANDERFSGFFDTQTKSALISSEADLSAAARQLKGERFSRLIITSDYAEESPETTAFLTRLDELRSEYLTGNSYLVGTSAMVYEMENSFNGEFLAITLITAIAIFFVVLLAFRNFIVPALLTLLVQCGVYITVSFVGIRGGSLYYLALLIVQSILMGATIDYGIIFSNFYRESRRTMDKPSALKAAYEHSIHTVITSGSILILVTGILGVFSASELTSQVCLTISIGSIISVLLILTVLPGILDFFDKAIISKKQR